MRVHVADAISRGCAAALLAVGALLVASGAAGQPTPTPERTLAIALSGYENNLTPFTMTFDSRPNHQDLLMLVYDSLFWSQASADPEAWLAEKAEASADLTSWTVTLRRGLVWHDGHPLTAEDVAFTFDYFLKQARRTVRWAHHVYDTPPFESARVLDDRRVRLRFKAPAPTFKVLPGGDLPILPRHVWQHVVDPFRFTADLPVGSGPYRVVSMDPSRGYVLEANRNYFRVPAVDRIVMPIITDEGAAFSALEAGDVDLVARNIPSGRYGTTSTVPGVKVSSGGRLESTQLYFNARKAPLSDARLRKAISLAINNEAILTTVLDGRGRPGADSFLHPESPWALPDAGHEFDVGRARSLLDQAGYVEVDPDGVRRSGTGDRLAFSVMVSSSEPRQLRALEAMAGQVQAVGVKLVADVMSPSALAARTDVPVGQQGGFDAYVDSQETHIHVDPDGLYYLLHSPGRRGFGQRITGYSNPAFDKLAEESTTAGLDRRKALAWEMQRMVVEDAPVVAIWYADDETAYRPAAYDRWQRDFGHGLLTKRSFLSASRPEAAPVPVERPWIERSTVQVLLVVGTVVACLASLIVRTRKAGPRHPAHRGDGEHSETTRGRTT